MVPRTRVDFLTLDEPLGEMLRTVQKGGYTRLPLCDGDIDHVIGLVHMKDLFSHLKLVPGKLRFTDGKTPDGAAIAIADGLKTVFMPPARGDDLATTRLRAELWTDDRTVVGASDAGAHMDMIDTFAFSTKLLGASRRHDLLPIEQSVRQLTSVPARMAGLRERGELRVGWCADIVVFDPTTVECGATYTRFDLPGGGSPVRRRRSPGAKACKRTNGGRTQSGTRPPPLPQSCSSAAASRSGSAQPCSRRAR